jgi:hypothetical protein
MWKHITKLHYSVQIAFLLCVFVIVLLVLVEKQAMSDLLSLFGYILAIVQALPRVLKRTGTKPQRRRGAASSVNNSGGPCSNSQSIKPDADS